MPLMKDKNSNLVTKADIPPHLAFNKYIIKGYRAGYSVTDCFQSLFQIHNETVNIYTHGFMALYLMFVLLQWPGFRAPVWHFDNLLTIHCLASLFPFVASTIYHLFLCHHHGSVTYYRLLCFDMVGVWAVNTFGYIIAIITTFECFPSIQLLAVGIYLLLSAIALYYLVTAKTAMERFVPLTFYAVSRPLIILSRFFINFMDIHSHGLTYRYYILMDCVALIGAAINVCKFPERFRPGLFDIYFNSHQIMHLCAMGSIIFLNEAVKLDVIFLSQTKCRDMTIVSQLIY